MTDELIPVEVECRCAEQHDHDTVYLRPRLGLAAGIAIQRLVVEANQAPVPATAADMTGVLAEAYLLHGIESWTIQKPVTAATIRAELLDDFARGAVVADRADDLYMAAVLAPLLKKAASSLPGTSSNGSTSVPGNGHRPAKKRSKPSSTTTTPMVATATTSE
jgi:hypothetical protein